MELHELHVLQRYAGPEGHRETVWRGAMTERGEWVQPPGTAGGDDPRFGPEVLEVTAFDVVGHHPREPASVLVDDRGCAALVVELDVVVPEARGVERAHLEEAHPVLREAGPRIGLASEVALRYLAVLPPGPGHPPVLQLDYLLGSLSDEELDRVLVRQEVAALHGVPHVRLEGVPLLRVKHRGCPSLGGDAVGPHRLRLGHDRDPELGTADAGGLYRGPQPREA